MNSFDYSRGFNICSTINSDLTGINTGVSWYAIETVWDSTFVRTDPKLPEHERIKVSYLTSTSKYVAAQDYGT